MRTRIDLPSQRFLIAGHSLAARKSRLWLVYLPESGAGFHPGTRAELAAMVGQQQASKLNYLVINKPGLKTSGRDRDVFERSFRRRLRIEDAILAIERIVPEEDQVFVVGYSEGAYLAPELAVRLGVRKVRGVVMIGGGTRGWLNEELSNSFGREKAALRRQIARIEREKESIEKWNGFSFATWNSYSADTTLISLKKLPGHLPMLAILGRKDVVIDLKSTLSDLHQLAQTKNLQTEIFASCGHSFGGHWPAVRSSLTRFLAHV